MTNLEQSLASVAAALVRLDVSFMLIGGLAVSLRQEPRTTLDIDLSLWVEPGRRDSVARSLLSEFAPAVPEPLAILTESNVLPLLTGNGVRVDLVFATLDFEKQQLARATAVDVAGTRVPVATVEDLVLMKLVSERDRDRRDAVGLLRRHRHQLDRSYLDPLLEELAEALYRPDLMATYRQALGEE